MQKIIEFKDYDELMFVLGPEDKNLKKLKDEYKVKIWARGHTVVIEGKASRVKSAQKVIQDSILYYNDRKRSVKHKTAKYKTSLPKPSGKYAPFFVTYRNQHIVPRTSHQDIYVKSINKYDVVFSIGPAGTGKTFLAVAAGLGLLAQGNVERIILTRPVIEAGEKLGFLPGDLTEKMNPYIKPLEDSFISLIGVEKYRYYRDSGIIEIVPLAYMRGRTLNDAYIVLDEAQNTSSKQMMMFLTRLGANSQTVITGDITQVDLEHAQTSGLIEAERLIKNIRGVKFNYFTETDVLRHPLVKKIVSAYSRVPVRD
ncbi:PhoH family protein [bacterium]